MDTKERWTPVRRPVLPDPKPAPGTARSGKNRIRKTGINFKGALKFFFVRFIPDRQTVFALQNDPSEQVEVGGGSMSHRIIANSCECCLQAAGVRSVRNRHDARTKAATKTLKSQCALLPF
jgi:hypothetical protein